MALSKPWPVILRIILIALVFFVLLVTLIGHFGSDWTHRDKNHPSLHRMYFMCTHAYYNEYECPDISMEQFYVAMLFLCLFWAIGSTLLVHFNKNDNKWLRLVDFILYVVLGFFLLIGTLTFVISTLQVKDILDARNKEEYDQWYQWIIKLIAAALGLPVVGLHGFLAFLIGKPLFEEFKKGRGGNAEEEAVQVIPSKQEAEVKGQPSRQSQKV